MAVAIDIRSAVSRWCKSQFILRSSFYTGRGVNLGDLNSDHLEDIYQGLKAEVGIQEAKNFVQFVHQLKDLSASAFIQAFERFWYSECQTVMIEQSEGSGNQLTGRGDESFTEEFILIGMALSGRMDASPQAIEAQSRQVKEKFIRDHATELTVHT